jgi:hypothetical protein
VWPDLRGQISVEQQQLQQLFAIHERLLRKCATQEPDPIELSALATFLHSMYTGIENIFRRVAVEIDGGAPRGEAWHRRLLEQVAVGTDRRPPVISESLRDGLKPHLQFRHVFRNAYSFQLQWEKMQPLVDESRGLLGQLQLELEAFGKGMDELFDRTG